MDKNNDLLLNRVKHKEPPKHVAIIMDGNGRWATKRGLERGEGHRAGLETVGRIISAAVKASVKYLTLYAFSTENWDRPKEEIEGLMNLMIYAFGREEENLVKNGVKVLAIGDLQRIREDARNALNKCISVTSGGANLTLILALSYSSKWELTQATRLISQEVKNGKFDEEDIDEELIERHLATFGIPDPDLLIRTGGEQRISNFLLWQSAYSEFYFTKILWPDFNDKHFYEALLDYQNRERRFGKTGEQISFKD